MSEATGDSGLVLLTGASGYVGGRLLRVLEADGRPPALHRATARRAARRRVAPGTEVVAGTSSTRSRCAAALDGVDTAYYLIHSMGGAGSFEVEDRRAARDLRRGRPRGRRAAHRLPRRARRAGDGLSAHLASRQEVGRHPARLGRPDDRVAGVDRHRLGQPLVRDDPCARGPPAGDGHAAAGCGALAQPIAIEDVLAYLPAARRTCRPRTAGSSRSAAPTAFPTGS